jgi:hypothetical protein
MSEESISFLTPLLWGAVLGIVLLTLFVVSRKRSSESSIELTPNCLLTRFPVLLLTSPGRRGPSKFAHHDKVYEMLKAHGYKVEWVKIPIDSSSEGALQKQLQEVIRELSSEGLQFHFFVDPALEEAFHKVQTQMPSSQRVIVSSTALEFAESRAVLQRTVELAEQDFIGPSNA